VQGIHTYYAGVERVLVHNCAKKASGPPKIKQGSSGGATAGRRLPESVKRETKADDPSRTCVFCRRAGTGSQVDHSVPRARGGNATKDNAQLACPHCNQSKGSGDYPKNPPPGHEGPWPPKYWKNKKK
jgi:filamentous hemagglutinin